MANSHVFLKVYRDVSIGRAVSPRGQLCREQLNYQFVLDMGDSPWTEFAERKLNKKYAKQEFLWYLRADKFDRSIEEHATMWKKIIQPDGSYFSNYGQYLFPEQFEFVVNELNRDQDSRRASMVLLKKEHLFAENTDVVCTYAINFRIIDGTLHMTVMMRSNDVIFGMTNDVFCFSMLYRLIWAALGAKVGSAGSYTHFVNSLHVYERHFAMIESIVRRGIYDYTWDYIPWPNQREAIDTVQDGFQSWRGDWSAWLADSYSPG